MADLWRPLTECPVCLAWVHLGRDLHGGTRQHSWHGPRARVQPHRDNTGQRCIMSHREAPPWDEPTTRAAASGRSQGVCEFCRRARATDKHHRKSRGVGGQWHPANIIDLCRGCHSTVDDTGYANGLKLHREDNPEEHPILTPFGWLWLTDQVTQGPEPRTRRGAGNRRK